MLLCINEERRASDYNPFFIKNITLFFITRGGLKWQYVCECVCVRERERERESGETWTAMIDAT